MKLSSTLLLLASIAAPAFADISHPEVAAKLLRSARRLEAEGGEQQQDEAAGQEAGEQQQQDQQQQQAYEEEQWTQQINDRFSSAKMEGQVWPQNTDYDTDFNFLWKYSLKMISCQSDVPVLRENGSYDNNSVVLRLCPHDKGGCNSNKQMGCSRGYGDFVVSLETYMSAYFEDKERYQQMYTQEEDQYNGDAAYAFATCNEYERGQDNQEQQVDNYNHGYYISDNSRFYVGPTCTKDGTDIRLAVFQDEFCAKESSIPFRAISNGNTLPFSKGGMISNKCMTCKELTNGRDIYSSREFCKDVYSSTVSSCEKKMETTTQYGPINTGCEYIYDLLPHSFFAPPKLTSDAVNAMLWTTIAVVSVAVIAWLLSYCYGRKKAVIPYPQEDGMLVSAPKTEPMLSVQDKEEEDPVMVERPTTEGGEAKKSWTTLW